MALSFHHLPSDVILHNILPFLDYDSRQTMNRLLPSYERSIKRIPLEERIKHDMFAHLSISQNLLKRMDYTHNKVARVGVWRNYCKELMTYKVATLLQYAPNFRLTITEQLANWSNEEVLLRYNIPSWLRKRVKHLTQEVIERLEHTLHVKMKMGKIRSFQVK